MDAVCGRYESVLDKVVKEINASRPFMPVIYIETEDRDFVYELFRRKDCFDVLQKCPEGGCLPVSYERGLEGCNVIFIEERDMTKKLKIAEDWGDKPLYFCVRDFQVWDSSSQRALVKAYIREVFEKNRQEIPLRKNLILVSAASISIGEENCCMPDGYGQYVKMIDVPLLGLWEIAEMVTDMQNGALRSIGAEPIRPEEYLRQPDGYIEGFKGMNRAQIQYILLQLQNIFGMVSACGLPENYRRKLQYEKLEEKARSLIFEQKSQAIAKSGEIRYLETDTLAKPGGMEGLEEWLRKKKKILEHPLRAKQYGERFPKGILIAGLPGSGKSLMAKYVAQEFGIPLIQFKMDMVLQGYVGASEQRLNRVLKLFEASAPCVIWLDEIEKELAGMHGSGETDSGVNKRCLAKLLNWMQENKASCFICATANHTDSLPPELLRRGRFDRLYYAFLPMEEQCVEIMMNHLYRIRQDTPGLFAQGATEDALRKMCGGIFEGAAKAKHKFFTGSDIEGLVRDARSELFDDMEREGPYTVEEWETALRHAVEHSLTYAETNFEGLLDYWLGLRKQQFRNTAVPEQEEKEGKYRYMLFDFTDLEYDGSSWEWRKGLECHSACAYDKNMFQVLTESLKRKAGDNGKR